MAANPPDVSVVVPCYRSGEWLGELVGEIKAHVEATGRSLEIILVNDGSEDDLTWPAIRRASEQHTNVHGIDLTRNVGQFRALLCGLGQANGAIIVTLDDDFQHPPSEIPKLIDALEGDPELDGTIARFTSKAHSPLRNMGSGLIGRLYEKSYDKPAGLTMSSFRALRRDTVQGMLEFGTAKPMPGGLLLKTTKRLSNVDVEHRERRHGVSGYGLRRLVSSTADTMINVSVLPLRAVSVLGVIAAVASAILLIVFGVLHFTGRTRVAGFTTIVLLVSFFGGSTLLSVGLLGEYVARIVREVVDEPLFIVRQRTRS